MTNLVMEAIYPASYCNIVCDNLLLLHPITFCMALLRCLCSQTTNAALLPTEDLISCT